MVGLAGYELHDRPRDLRRPGAHYRLQPDLSLGLEAGFNANALDRSARAGLFLRYEWEGGESSASAGVTSGDVGGLAVGSASDDLSAYGTINVIFKF